MAERQSSHFLLKLKAKPRCWNGRPACRQAGAQLQDKMIYYVYVLQSLKNGTFYKGLTDNLERRILEHLKGKCDSTKSLLPVKIVHVELCQDRNEARRMEKYLKSGFGRENIKEIVECLFS